MRQTAAIVTMNLSALRTRWGSSLVIVLAVLSLGAISTAMLSIATGALKSMDTMKQRDDAVVMSAGAQFEQQSSVSRDAALKIADAPGVKKTADGKPLAVAEVIAAVPTVTRETGVDRNLLVRGGSPLYFQLHPEFRMVEGRMFQPGLRELLIGREAHDALAGMDVGAKVAFPDGEWIIVGMYESDGRADWQLYGDSSTMMTTFHRNAYHSMTVKLESPAAFDGFKAALTGDPALNLLIERESDFVDRMNALQIQFYRLIGLWVGVIVALGVIFAAANMLYAAVSRRVIEIATLRALGFGATAVIVSVVAESLVLAAIGAAVGILGAWAVFDGVNYVGGGFHLAVTPALALSCAAATLGVGVLASLFPAIRAARLPVATALQAR